MSTNLTVEEYTLAQQMTLVDVDIKTNEAIHNKETLTELKADLEENKVTFTSRINSITPRLNTINTAIPARSADFDILISDEDVLYASISQVASTEFTLTLAGTIDNFYPIWFKFNSKNVNFLEISRNKNQNAGLFVGEDVVPNSYIYIEGCGYDPITKLPGRFTVRKFSENGNKSIIIPSPNLYSSREIGTGKGYYAVGISGIYLRGGLSYNFKCNDKDVIDTIKDVFAIGALDDYPIVGTDGVEYYATPIPFDAGIDIVWSSEINPSYGDQIQPKYYPGDIAIHAGGYNFTDYVATIQSSIVSKGSDAVITGLLSRKLNNHTSVSNGSGDRALHAGGSNATGLFNILHTSTISTGADSSDTGVMTSVLNFHSGISNGLDDSHIVAGGTLDIVGITNIQSGVVSVGSNTINTGNLSTATFTAGYASNGTGDLAIIVGGYDSDYINTIQRTTISTGGSSSDIGILTNSISGIASTSNDIDDIAIHSGGSSVPNVGLTTIQRMIISTGTNSSNTGVLCSDKRQHTSVSNGVTDMAIHTGGYTDVSMTSNIQHSIISTGADSIDRGILVITIGYHTSVSNA